MPNPMKTPLPMPQKFLFAAMPVACLLLFGMGAQAEEKMTIPEGFVTIEIAAGTGTGSTFTFFSTPLLSVNQSANKATGQITGVTAISLTDSTSNWTSNVFSQAGSPYFVRLTTGLAKGHMFQITANTSTTLTLDNAGVALDQKAIATGAEGDHYEIIQGDTLLGLLGAPSAGNPILGGSGPNDVCDKVNIMENGAWSSYFYNTTVSQWRRGDLPVSQNNKVLRPNSPILYSRMANTPLKFVLVGRVPDTESILLVQSNTSSGVTSSFPVDQTLASFNFQDIPGWKKVGDAGITTSNADQVAIFENGSWSSYHYNGTVLQWRRGVLPVSQNNKIIPGTSGILITRTGNPGQTEWPVAMPYSLE